MTTRVILHCLTTCGMLLFAAMPVRAGIIWTEAADAGDLPGTAQTPVGTGALSAIRGTLQLPGSPDDIDLYALFIPDLANFSATTVGVGTEFLDTQLFLFDAAGRGVRANDDTSDFEFNATLPTGAVSGPPGLYYLAVAEYTDRPLSMAGRIFPDADLAGVPPVLLTDILGPTGPGGAQPLSDWYRDNFTQRAFDPFPTNYEILLTGAEATPAGVPEPSGLLLFAAGCVSLLCRSMRNRRGHQVP